MSYASNARGSIGSWVPALLRPAARTAVGLARLLVLVRCQLRLVDAPDRATTVVANIARWFVRSQAHIFFQAKNRNAVDSELYNLDLRFERFDVRTLLLCIVNHCGGGQAFRSHAFVSRYERRSAGSHMLQVRRHAATLTSRRLPPSLVA
jgi:hypothetical protein